MDFSIYHHIGKLVPGESLLQITNRDQSKQYAELLYEDVQQRKLGVDAEDSSQVVDIAPAFIEKETLLGSGFEIRNEHERDYSITLSHNPVHKTELILRNVHAQSNSYLVVYSNTYEGKKPQFMSLGTADYFYELQKLYSFFTKRSLQWTASR